MILLQACSSVMVSDLGTGRGARYIKREPGNYIAVVFVHGFVGDGDSTWTNLRTGNYWPKLIVADEAFRQTNVYVYEYASSPLRRTYSIDELADNLRLVLDADGVFETHREVVFLAHSMGGLVVRKFLLKYRRQASKVRMIYFFATPGAGSPLASLGEVIGRNPALKRMVPLKSDDFLGDLQREWLAAAMPIASFCAYEVQRTLGMLVVAQESASLLCNRPLDPIDENHFNIVKPDDTRHASYLAFRTAFKTSRSSESIHFAEGLTLHVIRASPNLVVNGGFEEGLSGWGTGYLEDLLRNGNFPAQESFPYVRSGNALSSITLDTMERHAGVASLRIDHVSGQFPDRWGSLSQRISGLKKNGYYRLSFWVKSQNATDGAVLLTTDLKWSVRFPIPGGAFDWRKIEGSFNTGEADYIDLRIVAHEPARIWIDDIEVRELIK